MIFVTAHYMQPHGSARSARDFIRAALACQRSLHVVCPYPPDAAQTSSEALGGECSWITYRDVDLFRRFPGPRRLVKYARALIAKRLIIKCISDDWVVVNGWASFRYWKTLAPNFKARRAIVVRESPRHFVSSDRNGTVTLEQMLSGLQEFDRLIFVSERLQQEWSSFAQLADKPTFLLPNCCEEEEVELVQTESRTRIRESLGIGDDAFVVLLAGTVQQRKGHDTLLSAMALLREKAPNIHALLIGDAITAWGHEFLARITFDPSAIHITHLDAQPSVLKYMHASDVVVVPSRAEALPRTVLEAMCLGKAIVASDVDGIPELVVDGYSGHLFPPGDSNALAESLLRLATNREESMQLSINAQKRYFDSFSRSLQTERMRKMLDWLNCNDVKT